MSGYLAAERAIQRAPAHWQIRAFKRAFRRIEERNSDSTYRLLSLTSAGSLIPRDSRRFDQAPAPESIPRYLVIRADELALNPMWLSGGAIGVSTASGAISPDYRVFRVAGELYPRYAHHLLRSAPYRDQYDLLVRANTTFDRRIQQRDLDGMPVLQPPLDEQKAIADYLDRETGRIDALIARQERLIALLRERRRSIAETAVTRGIDQKVRFTAPTDPLLPPHPEHWQATQVRHAFDFLDHRRVPLSSEERGGRPGRFAYYGASGVIDHIDDYLFDEPLVLVSEDGANLLARSKPIAFAAEGRYWVNNHAHVLRPRLGRAVGYWAARLEALDVAPVVTGAAQPKLTAEALKALPVAAPPLAEQLEIQMYLEERSARVAALVAKAQRFIELSKERRAALITAAVTGQIDVRERV